MPSTSSQTSRSSSSRKFVWLALTIVAFCAVWTGGWMYAAARFEDRLPSMLSRISGTKANAECEQAEVRGYPFRFGLFCQTLSYANPDRNLTATSGALRSAAQIYRPGHVVAEIDGPVAITAPGLELRADWQVLQASLVAEPGGVNRTSLDGQTVSLDLDGAGLTGRFVTQAARVLAHARKNGPDLDVAFYGEQVQISLVQGLTAGMMTFEATLPGQAGTLDAPYTAIPVPFATNLHRLAIELDDATSLELSGPINIGVDRRITGDLEATIRGQDRIIGLLASLDPGFAGQVDRFAPLIASLDTRPGDDGVTLPLTIRDNRVSIGFFPLGELPGF